MELSLMPSKGRDPQGTAVPLAGVKKDAAAAFSALRWVRYEES
jgi:hypothetical protein